MSISDRSTGWQVALKPILEAGVRVRSLPSSDGVRGNALLEARIAAAKRVPNWILLLAVAAFVLPFGWIWATAIVGFWGFLLHRASRRAAAIQQSVAKETATQRVAHQQKVESFQRYTIEPADRGEQFALLHLLLLWEDARPKEIQNFSPRLECQQGGAYRIVGEAIGRETLPPSVPRRGRKKPAVFDQRTAGDIDEDLVELNAAAALSLLIALFSGPTRHRVEMNITLVGTPSGDIPWVTMAAELGQQELHAVTQNIQAPSGALRSLGGDVGRCRAQRFTPARALSQSTDAFVANMTDLPSPERVPSLSTAASVRRDPQPELASAGLPPMEHQARDGERFVQIVAAAGKAPTEAGQKIPAPPPERMKRSAGPALRDMTGSFGVTAKKWADYEGNPDEVFAPLQCYYPTYQNLDAAQLRSYFGWRTAFRAGKTPAIDMSYLFIHVYELLHVVGVPDTRHAASELERLWSGYRATYLKLDKYLVPWIADLYATEALMPEVGAWYRRALAAGATIPDREIVTDLFWTASDYAGMPRLVLATLAGDPKLGVNKFCQEHNGEGWVDRGYREAFTIADGAFGSEHRQTLREATVEADGLRPFSRQPFTGAVYDWTRFPITLGKLPNLSETSLAVHTFRGATRYAENLLRQERGFKARLRGIELDPIIASALDAHLARFIRATKPRPRVTIDLAKANELKQESSDVRRILLAGLDENVVQAPHEGPVTSSGAPVASAVAHPPPDHVPPGLLTDLTSVQATFAACSDPSRALLGALAASGWEASEVHPDLKAAAAGALIGPLVDEINGHAVESVGDLLIVAEGGNYVLQEDYRDEVHWILHGNLDDFAVGVAASSPPGDASAEAPDGPESTYGFGPVELQALRIIADGGDVERNLTSLGAEQGLSPLLLIDRLNELAVTSPYGDVLVDTGGASPVILDDGNTFAQALLARAPLLAQAACA